MGNNENTLATELLHELKTSAKRWFYAFCIMVAVEVLTIGGFLWYISLPIDEYAYTIDQDATDRSLNIIGGEYHGGETAGDSAQETESSTK